VRSRAIRTIRKFAVGDQAEVERPTQGAHLFGRRGGKRDIGLTEARVSISDGFLDGVIGNQDYDRANDRHTEAVEVKSGHAMCSEEAKEPSSNNRTDDSEDDVEDETFSRFVDDLLPMKPATRPSTIHAKIDIVCSP